ncbi:hypothetical protein PQR05_29630 [Paraburkholderia sediminicola]|uniref:hypothetical protein n=1 Tax=Paraburkholderia sediminicola TaxID=458836 RepID=UPI0038BAEBAE
MSLPDLSKAVSDQFDAIVASGAINTMIETHLTKTIDDILKDQLRGYSDFGKAVKERVEQALQVADLKDLPNYGQFVCNIIAKNVDSQLHGAWAKKLEADVAAMFIDPPAEIALEDLIEKFKTHVRKNAFGELDHRMTLHLEESRGGYWVVAMDKERGKERYRCDLRFQINAEGGMFGLHLDGEDLKKTLFVGPFDEFERLIFRMYVQGTKVLIPSGSDVGDFDLSLHEDD